MTLTDWLQIGMLPFLGIGNGGTMVVIHQTPTQCGTDLQWNEPHPVSVAHRQNVGEIAMHIRHSQKRLQRLGNPCTMREHVQIRVGSGTERPIVQCLNATMSHLFLGFRTVFKFTAAELGPRTIVFRIPLRKLLDGNALPVSEAAFAHAASGCTSSPSGSAKACAVAEARPKSEHTTSRFGISGDGQHTVHAMRPLFGEPALADFVEGNVDLALQTMLRIVGGAPVTHQRDGVHMFRYCAVMLKFDVSRHAAVLRCFLDYGIGEYHFT